MEKGIFRDFHLCLWRAPNNKPTSFHGCSEDLNNIPKTPLAGHWGATQAARIGPCFAPQGTADSRHAAPSSWQSRGAEETNIGVPATNTLRT